MTAEINNEKCVQALITIPKEGYTYPLFKDSFKRLLPQVEIIHDKSRELQHGNLVQLSEYEDIDFTRLMSDSEHYLANSYVYRKALIRKHFLAQTIQSYISKHRGSPGSENPQDISILEKSLPATYNLELDYAEFLDDALDEVYELRDDVNSNVESGTVWIVKPSMSDRGQGIRLFKTLDELQDIFLEFEGNDSDEEDSEDTTDDHGVITSQLRHFIIQRYIDKPLLLSSYKSRKFHIRCYVVASGALKVYVYKRMLALFASKPYEDFNTTNSQDVMEQLSAHLTNTCLQTGNTYESEIVHEFSSLRDLNDTDKEKIIGDICTITRQLFLAALSSGRIHFQPLPNAFEFYGLDFLVDEDRHVYLLECNAYPDFAQTGSALQSLVAGLFDSVITKVISPFFGLNPQNPSTNNESLEEVLDFQVSGSW